MVNELLGKVAIVTGGASGIGAGIVERFLAEGARVVIADIERDRGEAFAAKLGGDVVFRLVDVSDPEQVGALVAGTVDEFGGLDVMVNNAGISSRMHRSFLDDDLADFQRVMAVNVLGVMAGTRDAARQMASSRRRLDHQHFVDRRHPGRRGVMTYRASKAAVIHVHQIGSNRVGALRCSRQLHRAGQHPHAASADVLGGWQDREKLERFEARLREQMRADRPLQREGTPEDVAEAALYLAGDRSRYVTGTVLPVDGGTVAGKVLRRRAEQKN